MDNHLEPIKISKSVEKPTRIVLREIKPYGSGLLVGIYRRVPDPDLLSAYDEPIKENVFIKPGDNLELDID